MNWTAFSAAGTCLAVAVALFSLFYSRNNTLRDTAATEKDRALSEKFAEKDRVLSDKLDFHFSQQKDTLGRVDRNIENMGKILEAHMIILNDHATRIAVAETKLDHISNKRARAIPME